MRANKLKAGRVPAAQPWVAEPQVGERSGLSARVVHCWGLNADGQLGDGASTNRSTPNAIGGTLRFKSVDLARKHSCAVAVDNTVYCWGANTFGQLGDGTTTQRLTPTQVVR